MAALQHLSSSIIAALPSQLRSSFHVRRGCRLLPSASSVRESQQADSAITRRQLIGGLHAAAAISLTPLGRKALAVEDPLSEWERVILPIDPGVVLLDIAFVPDDPSHGFLLGTRQTILETKDGGTTWAPRSIPSAEDEDFNYRFNSISFKGNEGWIVGKPAILLHTEDAGNTWKRIPLSSQLPGDMVNTANLACSPYNISSADFTLLSTVVLGIINSSSELFSTQLCHEGMVLSAIQDSQMIFIVLIMGDFNLIMQF